MASRTFSYWPLATDHQKLIPTMQFFVLRVASSKEDRVKDALVAHRSRSKRVETVVGRILVPTEHDPLDEAEGVRRNRTPSFYIPAMSSSNYNWT